VLLRKERLTQNVHNCQNVIFAFFLSSVPNLSTFLQKLLATLILLRLLCWPTCEMIYALKVYLFYVSLTEFYLSFRAVVRSDIPGEAGSARF
jgi:hypothetical protein